MAKHWAFRERTTSGNVSFNMTPMIDCTFQLIIFFILASQMASESLARLQLARPYQSQAIPAEQIDSPGKVIVNVLSAVGDDEEFNPALLGKASRYQIGSVKIARDDVEGLQKLLADLKQASGVKNFCVEVRADHRVNYSEVQPVMLAAARARIPKMNITALTLLDQ